MFNDLPVVCYQGSASHVQTTDRGGLERRD